MVDWNWFAISLDEVFPSSTSRNDAVRLRIKFKYKITVATTVAPPFEKVSENKKINGRKLKVYGQKL